MGNEVQKAYDELRNALWMLALPLIFGILSLIISFQWLIQDQLWEERLQEINPVIEEVEVSGCDQPRPDGDGHICAQSIDWWSPIDSTDCEGGQCYMLAWLVEIEESYFPVVIPGLIPLIFLFVVMRKISKARRALKSALAHIPPIPHQSR